MIANDRSDFNGVSWRVVWLGGWIVEGGVESKSRDTQFALINFEHQALVFFLLRVVVPLMLLTSLKRVVLSSSFLVSQLINDVL